MRHVRPGRKCSVALFAASALLALPSCFFSRGGEVVRTDPTAEEAHVFADTFTVIPPVAKEPPAPPPSPPSPTVAAPREKEVVPGPVKTAPPEVSVSFPREERARLRRAADLEIAEADSLIGIVRGKSLSPDEEEILLTAVELLQNSRSAYVQEDFPGAIGLARKARVLTEGLSAAKAE